MAKAALYHHQNRLGHLHVGSDGLRVQCHHIGHVGGLWIHGLGQNARDQITLRQYPQHAA